MASIVQFRMGYKTCSIVAFLSQTQRDFRIKLFDCALNLFLRHTGIPEKAVQNSSTPYQVSYSTCKYTVCKKCCFVVRVVFGKPKVQQIDEGIVDMYM